jgi:hypothetical protein
MQAFHPCIAALAALMVLPGGCTAPPAPEARAEASVPAVPSFVRHAPNPTLRTKWRFRTGDRSCTATAAATDASLVVTVSHSAPISLLVTLPSLPLNGATSVPLRFSGPAGDWRVAARRTGTGHLSAELGSDSTALNRLLILLGGGSLGMEEPATSSVSLAISDADAQGQAWFDCARDKMPTR